MAKEAKKGLLKNQSRTEDYSGNIKYKAYAWPHDLADETNNSSNDRHPQYVVFYFNVNARSKAVKANQKYYDFINYTDISLAGEDAKVDSSLQNRATAGNGLQSLNFIGESLTKGMVKLADGAISSLQWFGFDGKPVEIAKDFKNEAEKGKGAFEFITYKRFKTAVVLPMPMQFRVGDQVSYETAGLGGLAGMAMNAMNNDTAKAGVAIKGGIDLLLRQVTSNLFGSLAQEGTGAIGMAGRMGDAARGVIDKATGQSVNNRTEQVFADSAPRSFSFSYQMAAKSAEENKTIQKIIKLFREHMRPELSAASGQSAFLTMPSEFDITMYTKNENGSYVRNESLPRIATCVLKSVDVDYTPNGLWVANKNDGSPQMLTLNMTFEEIEPIHRTMVIQGY